MALWQWAHPQGQGLDPAQGQPAVHRPRHRPDGVLEEPGPLEQLGHRGHQGPADHVGVPAQVLGRGVDDQVGPELERLLQERGGEGVVDRAQRPGGMGRLGRPAMSTTPSSGLVGVSTQTSRVSDLMACLSWSRLVMSTTLSRSPHPWNSRAATR